MNDGPTLLSHLTQKELLALALASSRRDDAASTLACLKEAAGRGDATGITLFMLGSEYAQLGMIAEAKDSMARALTLAPDLAIARFQLGMLHLTSGDVPSARSTWAALEDLDQQHPLAYLARMHQGMLHLIDDEFEDAANALRQGIDLNHDNEALNTDIRRIMDAIEHLPGRASTPSATASPDPTDLATASHDKATAPSQDDLGHLFISAYTQSVKPH